MQRSTHSASQSQGFTITGALWLKLAIVYLIVGVSLGIAMGVSHNFLMRPVHAHLNLLGWTTMALAGLVYTVFPGAGQSRLATVHFWLHNLSVPVMMSTLALMLLGHTEVVPILGISEIVAAAGVLTFACNLFINLDPHAADARRPASRVQVGTAG